jgi:hypothetical protein
VHVLGKVAKELPEVSTPLIEYLAKAIAQDDAFGCYFTLVALSHAKPVSDRFGELFQKAMDRNWDPQVKAKMVELLPKFGTLAVPLVLEQSKSRYLRVRQTAQKALSQFDSTAIPEMLTWFDREGHSDSSVLFEIDPILQTTKSTLVEWESSSDSELKARAERIRSRLVEKYGTTLDKWQ